MPLFRSLVLALGLLAATAHAGTRVLPPGAVLVDATSPVDPARLAIAAGEVLARVEAGDAEAAFARLSAIDGPLPFELTAARVIEALMARPSPAGERLLAALESVPVRVFQRHEETAGDWFLPLVDVPARARSARRVIDANAARDAALAALVADPVAAANAARTARAADRKANAATPPPRIDDDAMAAAIALLPRDTVDRLADAVAKGDVALASRPLVQLALRSPRASIWTQARVQGEPGDVLPLFAAVDATLSEDDGLRWLADAAKDARYASAAVMATGRMATKSSLAAAQLDAYLDRVDTGPSAAAALALHGGPGFLADIERRLAKAGDGLRVQHLALALRLADTPAAEKRLRALQHDPRLPGAARAELQR